MTLYGVIAFILRFSPNPIAFQSDYFTVVEGRPMIFVKYCLPVSATDTGSAEYFVGR